MVLLSCNQTLCTGYILQTCRTLSQYYQSLKARQRWRKLRSVKTPAYRSKSLQSITFPNVPSPSNRPSSSATDSEAVNIITTQNAAHLQSDSPTIHKYPTSNVTGHHRGPKQKLRAGYRAPSVKRTSCCNYFSSSRVSCAFCVYSKFGHHPHP